LIIIIGHSLKIIKNKNAEKIENITDYHKIAKKSNLVYEMIHKNPNIF